MKKIVLLCFLLSVILLAHTSCRDTNPTDDELNEYVNDWIYEQMNMYYYWNDKIPSKPNYKQTPDNFFNSLLNKYNASSNPDGDRFSYIQDNYADLLNSLGGVTSEEIGFEYVRINISEKNAAVKQYILLVLYPKLNTDAQKKGIKRGQFILQIDDKDITDSNYQTLLSGTGSKKLTVGNMVYNEASKEYDLKRIPGNISVQMHSNFAESPIYLDTVLTVDNNKKVGYLVYNFFANDKGDGSYNYDKDLMNALAGITSNGDKDFILDLRYNSGGDVSSAIALASALVKDRSTDNLLISMEFNPIVDSAYKKNYGDGYNEDYFIDKITDSKQQVVTNVPALNISNLYVLVSQFTASASELIINGLIPYMEKVILIGDTTVGKNVGSFVLYEKNDRKNKWAIMPITFKYFNSDGDSNFSAGFEPDYVCTEFDDFVLSDFGSPDDEFLNAALTYIKGGAPKSTLRSSRIIDSSLNFKVMENSASMKDKSTYDSRFNGVLNDK